MLRKCSVVITGFMCMVSVMLLFTTSPSFAAEGNGGNGGDKTASTGGCGSHLGSCVGGGWVYLKFKDAGDGKKLRPVKDSSGNITGYKLEEMSGTGYSFTSDTINGCGDIKGVYVSTWFYKGKKSRPIGTISNNNWNKLNGPSIYSNSAKEFDTVETKFETAKSSTDDDGNPIIPDGVNWNNVSWFCYDDSLEGAEAELWGTTEVSATTDGIAYDSGESTDNGYAGLKISSDSGSVDVTFRHRFYLDISKNEESVGDDLYFDFEDGAGAGEMKHAATDANGNNGTAKKLVDDTDNVLSDCYTSYCGIKAAYNSAGAYDYYEHTITIKPENFTNGNTEQICSKVSYKTILEISGEDIKYDTPNEETKGCIKVQLATTPGDDPPNDRLVTNGWSSVGQMFAGEDSRLDWFGSATSMVTRRLAAYDTVSYLVSSSASENTTVTQNTASRSTVNRICDYINANVSGILPACASVLRDDNKGNVLSGTMDNSNTDKVRDGKVTSADIQDILDSQSVVVPENYGSGSSIGAKYCTTRGYQYQYWYAHQNEELSGPDQDNDIWEQKDNRSYWYIFPSACEVIKKRPQVAIWNSSAYSIGEVDTAVSRRYANADMGKLVSQGGGITAYGSWAEYLAITNDKLTGLSSGAGLAIGRNNGVVAKGSLSNLTIANDSDLLGYAGINANGSYQQHLEQYLRDVNGTEVHDGDAELNGLVVNEKKVLRYKGDLTIKGNITTAGTSYSHSELNKLPQAIIFVDGNLNISKDVTQIDAWLIVTKKLNTCVEFNDGESTPANGACSNQIHFNGPVYANSLELNRTYGAERDVKAEPAEVFNMRADAYIWAYNQSLNPDESGGYDYKIVRSRELAPRF